MSVSVQQASRTTKTVVDDSLALQLKSTLRGELLRPNDSGYDQARSVWNAMIDRRPALIARCHGVADIITGVNFAREYKLPLSIKGGGHNISGLAVCDDGLMLDLSLMRGVWVDPTARTARAQPGNLLGDLDREAQVHGLAAVLGFISNTGIAGLTLGGGFGYLTRQFGWSCDNVLSMDVVTAEGRAVRASEQENSDLFWGLRGGGGNFGVVTSFEYRLHPVGPQVIGGIIAWRAEDAPAVLEMYQKLTQNVGPGLTCAATLRLAPPAPWVPREFHGKPIVALVVCHTGSLGEGANAVAPIKSFGSPIADIVQPRSFVSQQAILDATQPSGRRDYWKSEFLPRLVPDLLAKAVEHSQRIVSPTSAILLFPIDGALNRLPEDYSPMANRDARAVITFMTSWEKAEDDRANIEWASSAWSDIRPFSTGGTYVNFLTEEERDERIRAAYGKSYTRLVEVKTRWDPQNLFRMNKNIVPRPG